MKKLLALLLALTLLASFPLTAAAEDITVVDGMTQPEVTKDQTAVVEQGGTVTTNNGTVTTNNGTVTTNAVTEDESGIVTSQGVVTNNNGTIGAYGVSGFPTDWETKGNFGAVTNNNGDISSNKGTVTTNNGTVTTNNGTVTYNYGTVKNNDADGKVTVNYEGGVVTENNGKVSYNYGEVTENKGTVSTNWNTVKANTGTVNYNCDEVENLQGGEVISNEGTVTENSGEVWTNYGYGKVNKNTGTVWSNLGTVENSQGGKVDSNRGTVKENAGTVNKNTGTVENLQGGTIGGAGTLQAVEKDGKVTVVETEDGVKDTGTFYGVRGSGDGVDFTTVQVKKGIGATLRDLFNFTKAGHTLTGSRDTETQTEYDLTAAVTGPIWRMVALWLKNPEAPAPAPAPAPAGDDTPAAPASNVKYYAPVSEKDGVYTFDAETAQLKGVYVDGKFVEPENYTISTDAQGRLEITFTAEYLAALASGEHTVWLNLTDGGAVFKLIIE